MASLFIKYSYFGSELTQKDELECELTAWQTKVHFFVINILNETSLFQTSLWFMSLGQGQCVLALGSEALLISFIALFTTSPLQEESI